MPVIFKPNTVLVAPLDWGLGHATRCIPLIQALIALGHKPILAGERQQEVLLRQEFPHLKFLNLEGYRISYSRKKWWLPFKLLLQFPKVFTAIDKEHSWLEKIIKEHKIDLVISDNRYGLWTDKIPCVIITHQLLIKAPFVLLERCMQKINYNYIRRFSACWVPDEEGTENVAGDLSHPKKLPAISVHYMGLLSRFNKQEEQVQLYDCCIALSGPEPQRGMLEKKILEQAGELKGKILLVRGKPGTNEKRYITNNIEACDHLPGNELQKAFQQSEYIICRSGYTTVMELLSLQKKAILIPTPGQTEQEYLAARLMQKGICFSVRQDDFNLKSATEAAEKFQYKTVSFSFFSREKLELLMRQL